MTKMVVVMVVAMVPDDDVEDDHHHQGADDGDVEYVDGHGDLEGLDDQLYCGGMIVTR